MKLKRIVSLIIVSAMLMAMVVTLSSCGEIFSVVKNVVSEIVGDKANEDSMIAPVELKYANGDLDPYDGSVNWESVEGFIFDGLWEPGYTVVKHIMVTNISDRSGMVSFNITPEDSENKLSEVIEVYYFSQAEAITSNEQLENGRNVGTVSELNSNKNYIGIQKEFNVKGDVSYDYVVNGNNDFIFSTVGTKLSVILGANETKIVTIGLRMKTSAGSEYASNNNHLGFALSVGPMLSVSTNIQIETGAFDDNRDPIVESRFELPTAKTHGEFLCDYDGGASYITDIASAAAVLVDVNAGKVIASKNADEIIYPASLAKIMTLLVACENAKEAGRLLTVEQWMIDYQQKMGASGIMDFSAGEQISVEDTLYLISYNSDTVACLLIAKYVSENEASFVNLMNDRAKELGLTDTHFENSTGLHHNGNYTTCREMAAIMNCAMSNRVVNELLSSYEPKEITVYEKDDVLRSTTVYASWYSDNNRFDNDQSINGDMTVIAGRTGYEDIPTACFATMAEHKSGARYICVTVGRITDDQPSVSASQSTEDTKTIYERVRV